jgi:hypothetical protein
MANQIMKWDGAAWGCAADVDTNSGGTVTSVTATTNGGIAIGGTAAAPSVGLASCTNPGYAMKWNGTSWGCAADVDTNTTYTASAPVSLTGTAFSLQSCATSGNVLRWNGTAWACMASSFGGTASQGGTFGATAGTTSGHVYPVSFTAAYNAICTYDSTTLIPAFTPTLYVAIYAPYRVNGGTPVNQGQNGITAFLGAAYLWGNYQASVSVTAGNTYELGCAQSPSAETVGKNYNCTVRYHCTAL